MRLNVIFPTFLVVVCLSFCLPMVSHAAGRTGGPELFEKYIGLESDVNPLMERMTANDPTVMRSRPVTINFNVMNGDTGGQGGRMPADRLQLDLFPDAVFTAVIDRIEKNPSGSQAWIGHLDGVALSNVTLVHQHGLMAGNVSLPGAFYQIRYLDSGIHAIRQIDQSKFPEGDDAVIPPKSPATASPDARAMKDDGGTVDVMVVYTPSARSAAGGTSAMNAIIDLAISETNTSYQNSGINHRVRLMHRTEVSYAEQGFSADLRNLTGTTDGYMDNVHTLRNQYGADEVVLLINNPSLCGLAWLMTTVSTSFASNAFAVVDQSCATGNYSFGHEIGHNMGARHDRHVDNSDTPYATSHGYVNVSARWRTVMAYNDKCTAAGTSCTRIQYWSNPNVNYKGNPTGVASGASAADNRSTLNNTALTVANFRAAADTLTILPDIPRYPRSNIVVAPYWQSDSGSYTFISISHPSLAGMASAIGVKVSARNLAGATVNSATFTVTADTTQRLFIIATNSSEYSKSLTPAKMPTANFMTNVATFLSGNLVITPVASDPTLKSSSGGFYDGFRDITMLAMWGTVIVASTSTGFTMEFIGDLADSRNPSSSSVVSAGVN